MKILSLTLLICFATATVQLTAAEAAAQQQSFAWNELFETVKKSEFAQGVVAGATAQLAIETARNFLPAQDNQLCSTAGWCPDRLTGVGYYTAALALLQTAEQQKQIEPSKSSYKRHAGILAGILLTATLRKAAFGNAHSFSKAK